MEATQPHLTALFNELFQKKFRVNPSWHIDKKQLKKAVTFTVTIILPGSLLQYQGKGTSEKEAKRLAAEAALKEKTEWFTPKKALKHS